MLSISLVFKGFSAAFQTSLVCVVNKPCLHCKEALFVVQRSLVCRREETYLYTDAADNLILWRFADNPAIVFVDKNKMCNFDL